MDVVGMKKGRGIKIGLPIAKLDAASLDEHLATLYPSKDVLDQWVSNCSRVESPPQFPGQASHAKDAAHVPTSDLRRPMMPGRGLLQVTPETVIKSLDPGFFTPEFDPILYYLENCFPEDLTISHETFHRQITEKDIEKDMIMRQLANEVEQNYGELIDGMRQVNQVDLDVAKAGIEVTNCRLRLTSASKAMTEQLVKIIQLHKRREKLLSVRKVANQISELKKQYELMGQYISSSDFHTATQCALYVRHVSKDPEFCEYKAVQAIRDRMYDGLPDLRRRIDKGLMRLCSHRFDGKEYTNIVLAYGELEEFEQNRLQGGTYDDENTLLNDKTGCLEGLCARIQRFLLADLDNCCRAAIIEQIIQGGEHDTPPPMLQRDFPLEALHSKMRPSQLVPCVVRTCELLAEVIHTHYVITQWHRTPLDERNYDTVFLHRCGVDLRDPFDFDDDERSDEEDLITRSRVQSTESTPLITSPLESATESPSLRANRLTKTKLSFAYAVLSHSRAHLWENVQRGLTSLFNAVQATSSIRIEEFLVMCWTCDNFELMGQEFCKSASKTLQSCVRTKSVQYFQNFHAESMAVLSQMLEREPWLPVPIRLDELGGVNGIIRMNERQQAPADVQRASQLCVRGLCNKELLPEGFILQSFATQGNPFSLPEQIEGAQASTVEFISLLSNAAGNTEEDAPTTIENSHAETVVTQTALNAVARYTGRYLGMMKLMRPAAQDIFGGICQLYDLYLFGIFQSFVSDDTRRKILSMDTLAIMEMPAPQDSQNFASVRKFIKRVMADIHSFAHDSTNGADHKLLGATLSRSGSDDDGIQHLLKRVVASESGEFIVVLLKQARPRLKNRLPPIFSEQVDAYTSETSDAANQLSTLVYRDVAQLLVDRDSVIHSMDITNWDIKESRTEAHDFIQEMCARCARVWSSMDDSESELSKIPPLAKEQVWLECCQAAFDCVLEGFSRARRVSTQGRGSMVQDLQHLNKGLEEVHRCRPPRGKDYVGNFISAAYLNDDELVKWISNNFEAYAYRHVASLLNLAMYTVLKKKKLKDTLSQVEEMYAANRRSHRD